MPTKIPIETILEARECLKEVVKHTPLTKNETLSNRYQAKLFLKREDLQVVRSYKIRGAYNLISSLNPDQRLKGIVCASAGNHAQGVAYSCNLLQLKGYIYMPATTPKQKVNQVRMFGKAYIEVVLIGDTFDDAYAEAIKFSSAHEMAFIHPFDHEKIIAGQGTVGVELLESATDPIDYLIVPVGGGGLIAGLISYFSVMSPNTKIIGVEPQGAPAMFLSLQKNENTALDKLDKFVDGAAVKRVGNLNFSICQNAIHSMVLVPEGKVCSTIIQLYNEEAIVVEPAGALSIAALDYLEESLEGKHVVCIVSGGNNDLGRMEEIKNRSLLFEGLKHYFIVNFPQRAGALREFLDEVLGPNDDITHFEYTKKTAKEYGPAFVGIELKQKEDYEPLLKRMVEKKIDFKTINNDPNLFNYFL